MNADAPSSTAAKETESRWGRLRNRARDGEEGAALVEFALCLPPLLILMTGIFAFGIAISNYVMLTNAASVAGMQLGISRGNTLDPCATASTAVFAAAPTLKQSGFTFAYVLNGNPYSGTTCPSSSNLTGAAGDLKEGKSAQITITYPCNVAIYKTNNFPNCTLSAKTSELVQ